MNLFFKAGLFSLLTTSLLFGGTNYDLLRFSYIGDNVKVAQTLKHHPDINTRDNDKLSPLLLSALNNHIETLTLLLNNGADINATSMSGRNALYFALQNRNPKMAELLLERGISTLGNRDEADPRLMAARSADVEMLKRMEPYMGDLNTLYRINSDQSAARNQLNSTLLIQAIQSRSLEVVEYLVGRGADVNLPNDRGETPILTALRDGEYKTATYLADHGAKLDARDVMGNTVLSYALNHRQNDLALRAIEVSDLSEWFTGDCVREKSWAWRDEEDISAHPHDEKRWNYLHIAALNNQSEAIKVMLAKGMKVEENSRGEIEKLPALAWAIKRGHYEAFKALLESGADPYQRYAGPAQGDFGLMYVAGGGSVYTPLSYALTGDATNTKIIDTLMALPEFDRYARLEIHPFYQFLLLLTTDEGGERQPYAKEILRRFAKAGFTVNGSDRELEAKLLMKQDKETKQPSPHTQIRPAIKRGDIEAIRRLKAQGVDIVKEHSDAPELAIIYDHYEMVLPLIDMGYDINTSFHNNETFLNKLAPYIDRPAADKAFWELVGRGIDLSHAPLVTLSLRSEKNRAAIDRLIDAGGTLGKGALRELYESKSYSRFAMIADHPKLQRELEGLYRDSNLTEVAIGSIRERDTPARITIRLFDEAYRRGLKIDYDKLLKEVENAPATERAIRYYGGIEEPPSGILDVYTRTVKVGRIEEAFIYYLDHAKELNRVEGIHDWSKAPLSIAIDHNKKEFYTRLIKAGAIIDDSNHRNVDNLISRNDFESIRLFTTLGMNINHVDKYNNSYFFRSLYCNNVNPVMAKAILNLGYNPLNPNLKTERQISDLSLAYKVATEKGDAELAAIAKKYLIGLNGAIDADESDVEVRNGKRYLKGSNEPFNGTLTGNFGEFQKTLQYQNGLKEGRATVKKPNKDAYIIAEFHEGIMQYGVFVHNADRGEATVCRFDEYGLLKECSEHSKDKKPFTPSVSRERVREILRELQ